MRPRERSDSGTFVETVTLADVLGVFDEVRGPVVTSSDVGEHLDCSTEAARQKLGKLVDQGKVDSRKTGRTTVWWETTATPSEQIGEAQGDIETSLDGTEAVDTVPVEDDDKTSEGGIQAVVRELDLEGSRTTQEAQEDALIAIVRTLRDQETATAGELKDLVDPDAVGYESADNFWSNMRRQDVFDSLPVETPERGGRTYTYTAESSEDLLDNGPYDPTKEFE